MIKRIKRWFKNEPNSRLTTLHENRHDTCMFLRNWGNAAFCASGRRRFFTSNGIYVCNTCIFTSAASGERNLIKLINDLEQIHEQTKQLN